MDTWKTAIETIHRCLDAGIREFVICAGARNARDGREGNTLCGCGDRSNRCNRCAALLEVLRELLSKKRLAGGSYAIWVVFGAAVEIVIR